MEPSGKKRMNRLIMKVNKFTVMIKETDLRIGNLCQDNKSKELLKVSSLSDEQQVIFTVVDRTKYPLPDGWQAEYIPLSPEWLEKFGFEKIGDWYQIRKLGGAHCLNYSIKHSAYSISNDGYENDEVGFKGNLFVHQLQNIYYWFTLGEELTIKETV
jgi:hypothetical protein